MELLAVNMGYYTVKGTALIWAHRKICQEQADQKAWCFRRSMILSTEFLCAQDATVLSQTCREIAGIIAYNKSQLNENGVAEPSSTNNQYYVPHRLPCTDTVQVILRNMSIAQKRKKTITKAIVSNSISKAVMSQIPSQESLSGVLRWGSMADKRGCNRQKLNLMPGQICPGNGQYTKQHLICTPKTPLAEFGCISMSPSVAASEQQKRDHGCHLVTDTTTTLLELALGSKVALGNSQSVYSLEKDIHKIKDKNPRSTALFDADTKRASCSIADGSKVHRNSKENNSGGSDDSVISNTCTNRFSAFMQFAFPMFSIELQPLDEDEDEDGETPDMGDHHCDCHGSGHHGNHSFSHGQLKSTDQCPSAVGSICGVCRYDGDGDVEDNPSNLLLHLDDSDRYGNDSGGWLFMSAGLDGVIVE